MDEIKKNHQVLENESVPQDEKRPAEPSTQDSTAKSASRIERLKKKILRLQGKNPDIYPMW